MDFTPTEEQAAVRGLATDLFATATHPGLGVEGCDTDLYARLVEAGLLGLSVREELGGGGLPLAVSAVVAEEAGKAAARTPALPVLVALHAACGGAQPAPANASGSGEICPLLDAGPPPVCPEGCVWDGETCRNHRAHPGQA